MKLKLGDIRFKRATAAKWYEMNIVLENGEPGFEYDTRKFKIGDGKTPWRELNYIGNNEIEVAEAYNKLPKEGNPDIIYRVSDNKMLYQWNSTDLKYEALNSGSFDPNEIKIINGGNANG